MIEIKCLDCRNCTGDSCKVYSSDADKAVKSCADDSFRNYKARMTREGTIEIMKHLRSIVSSEDCIEAFDMIIKVLKEPKVGDWIPISERLPENYKEVLVQWEKTNRVQNIVMVYMSVGLINEHGEWCNADGFGIFNGKVIAWQPLPEPYKAGEHYD